MKKMKIMQAQMPVPARKEEAAYMVHALSRRAAEAGADLLCLPEMFACPYEAVNFPQYAEEHGGFMWSECSKAASEHGIWLSAGSLPERAADGSIYNTAYVFDRNGHEAAAHRKMHLFDIDVEGGQCFRESDTLSAGNKVTVFDTEFGRIGLCICYDFRFPELGRLMALQGAEVILVPAAFNPTTGPAHWELTFRAQAMFNQVYTVGTAPALDPEASYHSWGHSIVVDPWGQVVNQMGSEEGGSLIELDLDKVRAVRNQIPLLKHRRTDVYELKLFD